MFYFTLINSQPTLGIARKATSVIIKRAIQIRNDKHDDWLPATTTATTAAPASTATKTRAATGRCRK